MRVIVLELFPQLQLEGAAARNRHSGAVKAKLEKPLFITDFLSLQEQCLRDRQSCLGISTAWAKIVSRKFACPRELFVHGHDIRSIMWTRGQIGMTKHE